MHFSLCKYLALTYISLAISVSAFAVEPLKAGHYQFRGYEKLASLNVVAVNTSNQEGKDQLSALQRDGYICGYKFSNTYRCTKNIPNDTTNVEAQLKASLPFTEFKVDEARGSAQLLYSSDMLKEWLMPQSIRWSDGNSFEALRMIESEGMVKVFLGSPAVYTFNRTDSDGKLGYPIEVSATRSKQEFRVFLLNAFFVSNPN